MKELVDRKKIIKFVETFYNDESRHFHNFTHILSAKDFFEKMTDEQYVAWLFHDIVYIPGRNDNEEKSEEFFQEYILWNDLNVNPKIVSQIILDTKLHKPTIEESAFVLDIDMLCLSLPYNEFLSSREEVIKEYSSVFGENVTKNGVKFFMRDLIDKKIYYTEEFFYRNELAQKNIEKYLSSSIY